MDLRTNVLEREDGTASDTSNVMLDGSGNLIKRNELKELNLPYGDGVIANGFDPVTELHPNAEVIDIIENGSDELLLFIYLTDTISSNTYWVNKLYRVTDLNTDPISIEEIPMQTWESKGLFQDHPFGRANLNMIAINRNVTYTRVGKALYIAGEAAPNQTVSVSWRVGGTNFSETTEKPKVPSVLKYDGLSFYGAGVTNLNHPKNDYSRMSSVSGSDWMETSIPYYIDDLGQTCLGTSEILWVTESSSYVRVPNVVNVDPSVLTSKEEAVYHKCVNLVTRGGFVQPLAITQLGAVSNPPWSYVDNLMAFEMDKNLVDPTSYMDSSTYLPLKFTYGASSGSMSGIVEGTWLLIGIHVFGIVSRLYIDNISPSREVTITKWQSYIDGKWSDVARPVLMGAQIFGENNIAPPFSGLLMATYLSKYPTYDFMSILNKNSMSSLGIPVKLGVVENKDTAISKSNMSYNAPIDPTYRSTPSLLPSFQFSVLSHHLEDSYPESKVFLTTPTALQVTAMGNLLFTHDGDFVYRSSTDINMPVDVFDPFENFSVGSYEEGGKLVNILLTSEYIFISRERKTYLLAGSGVTLNISARDLIGYSPGSVSPSGGILVGGVPIIVSKSGIFAHTGGIQLTEVGLPVGPSITHDFYDIGIDLSKTATAEDPVNRRVYFMFQGTKGSFALMYDFLHSEWFKMDGLPKIIRINQESKMIGTDGTHLYIESDDYISGVNGFYKSNYLTAGEPSLKKQWHKLILFLVGSPTTEIEFDSNEDWGAGESEADSSDTLIVDKRYVVDMKSFAPSDSYARTVEITSKNKNKLLVNGYQVTFDFAQDDPVDENEDNE